eukprot:685764-Amphidinium_carterae.1
MPSAENFRFHVFVCSIRTCLAPQLLLSQEHPTAAIPRDSITSEPSAESGSGDRGSSFDHRDF